MKILPLSILSTSLVVVFGLSLTTFSFPVQAGNVTLTISDGRDTVSPGEKLTHSITVTNTSKRPKNIVVFSTLPTAEIFFKATDGGRLLGKSGKVRWNVKVPANSTRTVQLTVMILSDTVPSTTLNHVAVAQGQTATDTTVVSAPSTAAKSSSSATSSERKSSKKSSSSSSSSLSSTSSSSSSSSTSTSSSSSSSTAKMGNLYISKDSTPVPSQQTLGGVAEDPILRLRLRATGDSVRVIRGEITITGPYRSIDRLNLSFAGSSTPFAVATIAGCGVDAVPVGTFCVIFTDDTLVVPENTSKTVLLAPVMKPDMSGAVSGDRFTATVSVASGLAFKGISTTSVNLLSANDGDAAAEGEVFIGTDTPAPNVTIVGNPNDVVLSKVKLITNANPDANGSGIPTGSQRAIGQFKFAAVSNVNTNNGPNKVMLDHIIFVVDATNVALETDSYKVYNKADAPVTSACTLDPSSTAAKHIVSCPNLSTGMVNTIIDPDSDITMVLAVNVTNTKVNPALNSTLQVSLQNFTNIAQTTTGPTGSFIRWIDKDAVSTTPFLWIEYPETVVNSTRYEN